MERTRWMVYSLLVTGAVGLSLLAACSDQLPVAPHQALMRPIDDGLRSTEDDCPDNIPNPEDCVVATAQQRLDLYWDLHDHVNWALPDCAAVGNWMKDFVLYGDLRTYPDFTNAPPGIWKLYTPSMVVRVSVNQVLWQQGWVSSRKNTIVHESFHAYYMNSSNSDTDGANWWVNHCINN